MWEKDGVLYSTAVEPDIEKHNLESPFKKVPKGQAREIHPSQRAINLPKLQSIKAAAPTAADDQIGQIAIVTQLYTEFGLLKKAFVTPKLPYEEGNFKEIDELLKRASELFGIPEGASLAGKKGPITSLKKQVFPNGSPIEMVQYVMDNSVSGLQKIYDIRLDEILGEINDDWATFLKTTKDIFKEHPALEEHFPNGMSERLLGLLNQYFNKHNTKDLHFLRTYKQIFEYLLDVAKSRKFKTPKAFSDYISDNELVYVVLHDGMLTDVYEKAITSDEIETTDELASAIWKQLMPQRIEASALGQRMSVLHYRMAKIWPKYKKFFFDFPSWIDYMEKNKPNILRNIEDNFELTKDELKKYDTFGEFTDWVWTQSDLMAGLYKRADIRERAKFADEERQGRENAVDLRSLNKRLDRMEIGGKGFSGRNIRSAETTSANATAIIKKISAVTQEINDLEDELYNTRDQYKQEKIKDELEIKRNELEELERQSEKTEKALEKLQSDKHRDKEKAYRARSEGIQNDLLARAREIIANNLERIKDDNKRDFYLSRNDTGRRYRDHAAKGDDAGYGRLVTKLIYYVPYDTCLVDDGLKQQIIECFEAVATKLSRRINKLDKKAGKGSYAAGYLVADEIKNSEDMHFTLEIEYSEKSEGAKISSDEWKKWMYEINKILPRNIFHIEPVSEPQINQQSEYQMETI
jgi:hypothetical protein